jgi:hypothetical protein
VLSIFRTNQLFTSILLAFYIALLYSSKFLIPVSIEVKSAGILSDWAYQWCAPDSQTSYIVAMVLLLLQAFYINLLVSEHRLANEVSLFPGLFYILISNLLPEFTYLSPVLMGNTFFIIAFGEILSTHKRLGAADRIFNVGFWIAVGSLFYMSYIVLIIFAFAGLDTLRTFKFRERLMLLTGLVTPYILLGTYFFWHKELDVFANSLSSNFQLLSFVPTPMGIVYRSISIFTLLLLIVNFSYRTYLYKRKMEVQRKINTLFWGLLATAISLSFQAQIEIYHLAITALPLGILLSLNFIKMPPRMAEVIHLLILAGILALQFQPWLFQGIQ